MVFNEGDILLTGAGWNFELGEWGWNFYDFEVVVEDFNVCLFLVIKFLLIFGAWLMFKEV